MTVEPRVRMEAEGLVPSAWSNRPFDRYPEHQHGYDKVLVAAAGSIVFHVPSGPVELRAGDRLDLPSGTPHAADVGPAGVTCLEAHLPSGTLGPAPRRIGGWALSVGEGASGPPVRAAEEGDPGAAAADG